MNERAGTTAAESDLPRWDLSDLFPGPDSPKLRGALSKAAEGAKAFATAHRGRLADAAVFHVVQPALALPRSRIAHDCARARGLWGRVPWIDDL